MAPSFQAGAQLVSQPPTPRRMPLPMMEEASAAWQFPDVDARNVGRGGDEQVRCNKNWSEWAGATTVQPLEPVTTCQSHGRMEDMKDPLVDRGAGA